MTLDEDDIEAIVTRLAERVGSAPKYVQLGHCDFDEKIKPKFESVFGIDCTDPKAREAMRKRMDFLDHLCTVFERAAYSVGFSVIVASLFGLIWLSYLGGKSPLSLPIFPHP